jgi:hypothetical protein
MIPLVSQDTHQFLICRQKALYSHYLGQRVAQASEILALYPPLSEQGSAAPVSPVSCLGV